MPPATSRWTVAIAFVAICAPAVHAAGTGTVRGAEAVNVRRAPNLNSPALASLPKGSTVAVDKVVGGWALVTLASGQQGFIKAVFLVLPAGVEIATGEAQPLAAVTPVEIPPTAAVVTPESQTEPARTDLLEHELVQLRERLAAIESAVGTPAGTGPPRGDPNPSGNAAEKASQEDEPTHVAGALLPTAVAAADPQEIGQSLALAGVGLAVGFLMGAMYGRRQERNRRSRVRF